MLLKNSGTKRARSPSYYLSIVALFLCDFGSGWVRNRFCRIIFIALSFVTHNLQMISYLVFGLAIRNSSYYLTTAPITAVEILFWFSFAGKGLRIRRLLKKINSAAVRIGSTPSSTLFTTCFTTLQVLMIVLPLCTPIARFVPSYDDRDFPKFLWRLQVRGIYRRSLSTWQFLTLLLVDSILEAFGSAIASTSFVVIYMYVCNETRKMVSSLRTTLPRCDLKTIVKKYVAFVRVYHEAEDLFNGPMLFFSAKAFILIFLRTGSIMRDRSWCSGAYSCATFVGFFALLLVCYLTATFAAAEFHEVGNRFKTDLRSVVLERNVGRCSRDTRFRIETIEEHDICYSGCKLYRLTRSFIIISLGSMLTYSLLFVQLGRS